MADENDSEVVSPEKMTNKPSDTAINQQRMKSWNPILHPVWVIGAYLILGAIFLPVGKIVTRNIFLIKRTVYNQEKAYLNVNLNYLIPFFFPLFSFIQDLKSKAYRNKSLNCL